MIFKNIFAKKFGEKNGGFFAQTTTNFCKKMIITLVFEQNADFLPKIAVNFDHNIDPSYVDRSPVF
jgi:hypothetical protein